jgi:hypothetical protein
MKLRTEIPMIKEDEEGGVSEFEKGDLKSSSVKREKREIGYNNFKVGLILKLGVVYFRLGLF